MSAVEAIQVQTSGDSRENPLAEPAGVLHERHAPTVRLSQSRIPRDATAQGSSCASNCHFMITYKKSYSAEDALSTAAKCANEVLAELFGTSEESRFEKAMEIALRLEGLTIELQRIVPVIYRGCALRDVRDELDIVVWVQGESNDTPKIGVVIELKVDATPDAKWQVMRYIKSLSSALPPKHVVYYQGLLISFPSNGFEFGNASGKLTTKVECTVVEIAQIR